MKARAVGAGIAGGLLAGAAVGAVEALASWFGAHGAGDLPPVTWALVVYGLIGAAGGFGAGIVAAIVGTDGFALALAGVGAALGFVVARFRIIRDVFLEQLPPGTLTSVVQLAGLLLTVALAIVVWRALRGADARRRALTRPGVAAALVAILALLWAGGSRLMARPTERPVPARAAAPPRGRTERDPRHGGHAARGSSRRLRVRRRPRRPASTAWRPTACGTRTRSRRRRGRARRSRRS